MQKTTKPINRRGQRTEMGVETGETQKEWRSLKLNICDGSIETLKVKVFF